jgi:cyclic pyranopterin phosphate synthase
VRDRSIGVIEAPTAPAGGALLRDRFGRVGTDLRVSLTDRCSLKCTYCMPEEGLPCLPWQRLLSDDEIVRLITIAVQHLGVTQVRLTGGEPLLRRGLPQIVAAINAIRTPTGDRPQIAMTTNGVGLARWAADLKAAGLDRVNVSVDTLDRHKFARITGRDRLPDVLAGVAAAADARLAPVKINTVLMRGVNDDEAVTLTRWAISHGYQLRFIEQMPLGPRDRWARSTMVTAAEILTRLQSELHLTPMPAESRRNAPAETWIVTGEDAPVGFLPQVGVIASVTRAFCESCNRVRITADGQLRSCLFAQDETDLRTLLRTGATDEAVADAWCRAMVEKPVGHGIEDIGFTQPERLMSAIGG